MYHFNEFETQAQVLELIHSIGIKPVKEPYIKTDGEIHRFQTQGDDSGETAGAYCVTIDEWPHGFVWDWRQHIEKPFSFNRKRLDEEGKKYFDTDEKVREAIQKSLEHQKELKEKMKRAQAEAATRIGDYFNQLPPADDNFQYFKTKEVRLPMFDDMPCHDIRYSKNNNKIAIPLKDVKGNIKSVQWIAEDGTKRFEYQTSTKGAFFSLNFGFLEYDKENTTPILVCEGVATLLTINSLTGFETPIVAAMSCGNYESVITALQNEYPGRKIIIMSDNDIKRPNNPGLKTAEDVCKKLKLTGISYPKFNRKQNGTDWNDYYILHGYDEAKYAIERDINLFLMPEERQKIKSKIREINAQKLKSKNFKPLSWAVDGFITPGVTLVAGGPKVGKSILALHLSLSVAIGGMAFGKIPVQKGSVLYLALEDTEQRLQDRIMSMGIENENLSALDIVTVTPRQNEGGLTNIRWWLEDHEDARLVVIDTLQKFRKLLSGKNSMYTEDYDIMSEIKNLADEFGVSFVIIHHLKKAGTEDWLNQISGSQGIAGAADTIISLTRQRNQKKGDLFITGRDVEECQYSMELDGFTWVLLGKADDTIPDWQKKIMEYARTHEKMTPLELSMALNIPEGTARQNLFRLIKKGLLKKIGYGLYTNINI